MDILVIGSSNTDLTVRAGSIPKPGETVLGSGFKVDAGGKGANQAVGAARLGAGVTFSCMLGCDAYGEQSVRNFRNENTAGENDPAKDHSFHHCMSQITLTFKAGSGVDFNTIKPTSYTLSGLVLEGSFDTTTGTAETDANAQTTDLTMELDGALTSSVILFPQSTTSIELSVNYNSQPYTAMLDIPDGALKAGNNYVWTITVRNKDLSVESAEITAWNKVEDSVNADL